MGDDGAEIPLLAGETTDRKTGLKGRLYLLIPVLTMYFYAVGIDMFGSPEYTQSAMKRQYMPESNETFNECNISTADVNYKLHQKVQRKSAEWTMYFALAQYVPATFTSLILGPLTDRLGRKFLLALSIFGYGIKLATWTVVARYDLSLVYVVVASFLYGLCGTIYAIFAVTFAFLSDVTTNGRKRTMAIVIVELFIGATVSVSSFVTGYFITSEGFFLPMLVGTCLVAVSLLLTVFLPETLQSRDSEQTISIISSAKRCLQFYTKTENKLFRKQYILLILSFTFFSVTILNRLAMDTLYELAAPFCWEPSKVGLYGTIRIGGSTLATLLILIPLRKCFQDDTIAIMTAFTAVASLIVEAFAQTSWVLYLVAVIGVTGLVPIPMIRSLMSQLTAPEQQGALFASIGVVETLCSLLGALTTNIIYSATLSIMNGFVFLIIAALAVISIGLLMAVFYIRRKHPEHTKLQVHQ